MGKKILKLFEKWRDNNTGLSFDEYCYCQGKAEGETNLDHAVASAIKEGIACTILSVHHRYHSMSAAEFGKWLEDEYRNTD